MSEKFPTIINSLKINIMSKADFLMTQTHRVETCKKFYMDALERKKELEALRNKVQLIYEAIAANHPNISNLDEELRKMYNSFATLESRNIKREELFLCMKNGLLLQIKEVEDILQSLTEEWRNALNVSPTALEPKTGREPLNPAIENVCMKGD